MVKFDDEKVEKAIKLLLEGIGDDPSRNGLIETPHRVKEMYKEILNGYDEENKIPKIMKLFDEETNGDMVMVKNVPFYSYCEHHLQPFFGKLAIAYIPKDNKIIGLSKLIRLARIFAKRPQVQERLTKQIAEALDKYLPNRGIAVRMECEHMCMAIRGVRTPGSLTVTMKTTGLFSSDSNKKEEFLNALK